ncbi:MAG TPA: hypothetical protein VG710_15175 [Opitutus sp.]|nr:hypothetical protein [Opitutus sp.]
MNTTVLTSIAVTGFTVAFFHAAIPTHWLPFVLVARARGWRRAKTVAVTAFAGLGHVAVTSALGFAIAWFGFRLDERVGRAFPWLAGGLLFTIGVYFVVRQTRGEGVCHHVLPGGHHHASEACGHEEEQSHLEHELADSELGSARRGDWAAIGGLFLMLTLSPCEGFLPIYLSGVRFGWRGFFVLSAILAVAALAGMTLFTWLALAGWERVKLKRFERWESGLLGALFCALGIVVVLLEK